MQIGKLKKGKKFFYNGIEFVITRSGFGTGKYVDVEFKKFNSTDNSTYCMSKRSEVIPSDKINTVHA